MGDGIGTGGRGVGGLPEPGDFLRKADEVERTIRSDPAAVFHTLLVYRALREQGGCPDPDGRMRGLRERLADDGAVSVAQSAVLARALMTHQEVGMGPQVAADLADVEAGVYGPVSVHNAHGVAIVWEREGALERALDWYDRALVTAQVDGREERLRNAAAEERAKLRRRIGLEPDLHDEEVRRREEETGELDRMYYPADGERTLTPFVRRDVAPEAADAGLLGPGGDTDFYFMQQEALWRWDRRNGGAHLRDLVPLSVAELRHLATLFERSVDDDEAECARDLFLAGLCAGRERVAWPPEEEGRCWCGSGDRYGDCCLRTVVRRSGGPG
ncbi:SEC-C motif-containing protein [Murinocardiopsis flavida]|uniref:SEC-C motif-containing protein n=1 Tax=Murinocardiopsis flavida TaxID=645275 RepID=A0A2P8DJA0_9ACTN|nr:SEC-C domain-containing protein [Murinocardiopsis flavida]PSK97303.1 SEC-C motif-containing protein [Murinocardiopsis flavida]